MATILVECTLYVSIDVDLERGFEAIRYDIEESHCPGTGDVGKAIEREIEQANEKGVCWGCNMRGKSVIIKGLD